MRAWALIRSPTPVQSRVLQREPDLAALPAGTPPRVEIVTPATDQLADFALSPDGLQIV